MRGGRGKVEVSGSGVLQESAMSPWKFIWSSRSSRLPKRRPSIFCDWESVAKRGSRFVGLDSIRKVSDEGSLVLWCPQPAVRKRKRKDVTPNAQRRRGIRGEGSALPGRGIRDFTENGASVRAGGAGKIARATMKCFISEERKGESFFGVDRNAKARGLQHLNAVV